MAQLLTSELFNTCIMPASRALSHAIWTSTDRLHRLGPLPGFAAAEEFNSSFNPSFQKVWI
jgi:hypothetical protein